MIYVTHDQAEAMTLADRVAVMDRGVVQQVDRPLVVYQQPVNRFVAGFLGWPPMNFVDGQLVPKDGQLCFVSTTDCHSVHASDRWCLPLPAAKTRAEQVRAGQDVTLGIRPEDIQLVEPGRTGQTLSMEVMLVEALGHSCLVTLQYGGWQGVALTPGSAVGGGPKPMVKVVINVEHAHLFDCATGLALSGGTFPTRPTSSLPAG
jgi:multiple sugar transport system ATP-binding protein